MVDTEAEAREAAAYREHYERLVGLAAALAGPSGAEDIASTVLLRCTRSASWPTVENPSAYLTRAVVNEVRSQHRSELRRAARELRFHQEDHREDAYAVPEVVAALAELPLQQRAVTFLTYWADLTPAGVAAELGITEGSVRKQLARARSTLRRILA